MSTWTNSVSCREYHSLNLIASGYERSESSLYYQFRYNNSLKRFIFCFVFQVVLTMFADLDLIRRWKIKEITLVR